jgi:hypothetical protein
VKKSSQSPLRPNQKKALEALLQGQTKSTAATVAGVAPGTLSRWLTEENFRSALKAGGDEALETATVRLRAAVDAAVSVFYITMHDRNASPSIRLRAADATVTHALKLIELVDLMARMDELEALLRERGKGGYVEDIREI